MASVDGRHLIDRISDWPNPHGFTKGVRFVCLNRYIQVDQKPFGQSEIWSIRVLRCWLRSCLQFMRQIDINSFRQIDIKWFTYSASQSC